MKKKNTAKKVHKRPPAKRRPVKLNQAEKAALSAQLLLSPVLSQLRIVWHEVESFGGKFLQMQASMAHLENMFNERSPTERLFDKIEHAAKDLQSYGQQYENGARMLNQAMGEFRDGPIKAIEEKLSKLGVSE